MVLSEGQINEFRQIYFEHFGKEISPEQANEQACKLLLLFMIIYKPMSIEDYHAVQRKRLDNLPEILDHVALPDNNRSI